MDDDDLRDEWWYDGVTDARGTLDAVVRLSPPEPRGDLVWVERYGRLIVTRYTCTIDPDAADVTHEMLLPSASRAVVEAQTRVRELIARGYTVQED